MKRTPALVTLSLIWSMFLLAPGAQAQSGDVVVATRQVKMKTDTAMFKLPIEAQRGERWEVVKKSKSNVSLTFGPSDERRKAMGRSLNKMPKYEVSNSDFESAFVSESDWPPKRKAMAEELHSRLGDLSIEQCERLLDGELWIGMTKAHAVEAVGDRIHEKSTVETAEGVFESWNVGFFSIRTTAEITAQSSGMRGSVRTPRFVLKFKNGVLTEIVRSRGF